MEKHQGAEALVVQPDTVKLWLREEFVLFVLHVHDCEPHNWERSEHYVVRLVKPAVIKSLSTEYGPEPEPELGKHEQDVFVEHINHQVGVSAVGFAAVVKHKWNQKPKLADGVVC